MFDAEKYIEEYQSTRGTARLRALKKAIQAADEAKDDEWSFRFRHRCIQTSTFGGDEVDGMILFPEMMALYDRSEELQADEDNLHTLLWDFKWIINDAVDFTHIPLEQIESLNEEFKKRLEANGKSLRPYYYLRENTLLQTGRVPEPSESGYYRTLPEDDLKDCKACEASHDVNVALLQGKREMAEAKSRPIFSGELHCAEIPHRTYAHWIDYDLRHGDFAHGKRLAKRLYPMVRGDMKHLFRIGSLLCFYSKADRAIGANIFRHELHNFMECRNHAMRFEFANGAYHLFKNMQAEEISMILPRDFPLWHEEHHYESAKLRDYFYEEAAKLAAAFDKRNGNSSFTDRLNEEYPDYPENTEDFTSGETEQTPSVLAAVCTTLPDELTLASVSRTLEKDGRYKVIATKTIDEQGVLAFQIAENGGTEEIYPVMIACQPVPDVNEFRPASPISDTTKEACENAEGAVFVVMPFEDKQPDLALHFQLRILNLICPDAVAVLDISRMKLLPAGWVLLAANSDVPPLVDYLYNLQLYGDADHDHLWIRTVGLRCCGLRELEILDATKENYTRFCDMLCFAAERILLRGEMDDAGTPFNVVSLDDGSQVVCTWVSPEKADADYPAEDAAGMAVRRDALGEDQGDYAKNAILYLYDGESADGSTKRKRLGALTEAEFERFRYGQFLVTGRKIAALAEERYDLFRAMQEKSPENSYVCVHYENEEDEDEIWVQVTEAAEQQFTGRLADDSIAGKAGDPFTGKPADLTDFSVRIGDMVIHPNTAYIALDIE